MVTEVGAAQTAEGSGSSETAAEYGGNMVTMAIVGIILLGAVILLCGLNCYFFRRHVGVVEVKKVPPKSSPKKQSLLSDDPEVIDVDVQISLSDVQESIGNQN